MEGLGTMVYNLLAKYVLRATSNTRGLIIHAIGLIGGVLLALATKLSFGLVLAAAIWIILGMPRLVEVEGCRRFAKVLYILLPLIGTLVMLVVPTVSEVERAVEKRPINPYVQALNADEVRLRAEQYAGDNEAFSEMVGKLVRGSRPVGFVGTTPQRVFTRISGDRMLVLVQIEWLAELSNEARAGLLDQISAIAWSTLEVPRDKVHIGIKGELMFGAMQIEGRSVVQKLIAEKRLATFYEPAAPPATQPDMGATTSATSWK